ncbi:hypothetical protein Trydic_g7929 [Trypoxylus dichotomus]
MLEGTQEGCIREEQDVLNLKKSLYQWTWKHVIYLFKRRVRGYGARQTYLQLCWRTSLLINRYPRKYTKLVNDNPKRFSAIACPNL